jgi:hypothetical protein
MFEPVAAYEVFERAAAANLLDYVGALCLIAPGCADAIECAGGIAAFTGPGSPLSVVKGVASELKASDVEQAESFFQRRGASQATFELAPWVAASSAQLLTRLGYAESGAESVVTREVAIDSTSTVSIQHPLDARELDSDAWGVVFSDVCDIPPFEWWTRLSRAAGFMPGAVNLGVAGEDGGWIACAQLAPAGNIAIFANDNTMVAARDRGIQKMLIRRRLRQAVTRGLSIAIAEVAPGSVSEANYVKCGFRVTYTRVHYSRELA